MSDRGYLWALTTEIASENKFVFIRTSQRCIEELLERFACLVGECHIQNDSGRKWLRWLGAEFGEPKSNLMVPFQIRRKDG